MSTITSFSAQELRDKLDLIDLNKNLLPYPYITGIELPEGIEDVGDGSFLTTNTIVSEKNIFLTEFILEKDCKYTISLDVTDALTNMQKDYVDHGITFEITYDNNNKSFPSVNSTMGLNTVGVTSYKMYLKIPEGLPAGLLIKLQIEKGDTQTAWVPYMSTIGSYVDERFNSTTARLRLLNQQKTSCSIVIWD